MKKYEELAKAIVDAFVGKMVRIALSALLILWIASLFQGMKLQKSSGFIGWSKTTEEPTQYKTERIGDFVVLTSSRKSTSLNFGFSLGNPELNRK